MAAMMLLLTGSANAVLDIAFNTPTTTVGNQPSGPNILGEVFTVNTPIQVTELGAFENSAQGGGFVAPVQVAIYNFNSQQLVSGIDTFSGNTPSTAGTLAPNSSFSFKPVNPVTLGPGTYMVVAAGYSGVGGPYEVNYNARYDGNGSSTRVTFNTGGGAISFGYANGNNYFTTTANTGMQFPTTVSGAGFANPRYAGPSFEFTPVPEVAAFGAAGVGLLGLVYIARYARQRRTTKLA
jgi:hypothetical protein